MGNPIDLGAPLRVSSSPSNDHSINIDVDAVNGVFYVLMISDQNDNDERGTTSIQTTGSVSLNCDVVVDDSFSCETNDQVDLQFTDSTEILRHNLAGYWALTNPDVGRAADEPLGIYYSKVGTYGADADVAPKQIGLRVTTDTPGEYTCQTSGENNHCESVMTGLDYASVDDGLPAQALQNDDQVDHFGQINMYAGTVDLNFEIVYDEVSPANR